jgi:transcriptional regulator GlxA family with amidase domain
MAPEAMQQSIARSHGEASSSNPAMHVDRALDMLRAHLLDRTVASDWDEKDVNEVARSIVTWLRESTDRHAFDRQSRPSGLSRDHLKRAVRFIHENLDSKLDWEQLANAVGLPPFAFGRSFKLATGLTPHRYVMRCRIRKAMNLLANTDKSICDIALDVGCSCQSHLTTLFRNHAGTTPRAFRMQAFARTGRA